MNPIFIDILNQSINAVYLMLAVMLVRLLIKRAPKWIPCVLWGLVAVKLVVPFSFESALSLVPSREPIPRNIEYAETPHIETGIFAINSTINPILENNFSPGPMVSSANPMQVVLFVCAYVWVAGILLMLAYFCISWLLMKRRVAPSQNLRDNIYINDGIAGPFILGVVRPRIYIPAGLAEKSMECVLEHEVSHIKRRDYLWKPLGYLILTVHWFNPLCWISYILLCRDIELACDEKVTRDKDKDWRAMYCQTLLDCGANGNKKRTVTACPIAFGEVSIKNRVKAVLDYKKPAFWLVAAAFAASAVVVLCFATSPTPGKLKRMEGQTPSAQESVSSGESYRITRWFDCLDGDEMLWNEEKEYHLDEFSGVTFRWQYEHLEAVTDEGIVRLYDGLPIWSVYFCDLTGDGKPELCSSISIGSGIIDNRIIVYDYAAGKRYELSDRGYFDYVLKVQGDDLIVEKRACAKKELLETGRLVFLNDSIQMETK